MKSRVRRLFGLLVGVALALSALSIALDRILKTETGLTRSFYASPSFDGEPVTRELASDISLGFVDRDSDLPRRRFSVEWSGTWYVPRAGAFDMLVDVDDAVEVRLDGAVILEKDLESRVHVISKRINLSEGPHDLNVRYEQHGGGYFLAVLWAPLEAQPVPIPPATLFPRVPADSGVTMNHRLEAFRRAVLALWLVPLTMLMVFVAPRAVRSGRWLLDQIPFPEPEV